jgi:hypothetical protein
MPRLGCVLSITQWMNTQQSSNGFHKPRLNYQGAEMKNIENLFRGALKSSSARASTTVILCSVNRDHYSLQFTAATLVRGPHVASLAQIIASSECTSSQSITSPLYACTLSLLYHSLSLSLSSSPSCRMQQ